MYGKKVAIPRLQAWYGDSHTHYQYSGLQMSPMPWTQTLRAIKEDIEQQLQTSFNSVLINLYRDGNDTVGWHSDDEPELGSEPVIASLSLGEIRDFQLKHKQLDKKVIVPLSSGSLFIMSGTTQSYWRHCIPRTKRVKSARINLTFRRIVTS